MSVLAALELRSPQHQRVTALKRQLDQARDAVKRQRLAAQQARLNQARAAMVGS